jgi:SAM-dependent methyltransferase
VWPSAMRMCDVCSAAKDAIVGRRVLELGCGPGLPGILCAQLGASHVLLTDFVPAVLDIARDNVEGNPAVSAVCQVARFDWSCDVRHATTHDDQGEHFYLSACRHTCTSGGMPDCLLIVCLHACPIGLSVYCFTCLLVCWFVGLPAK